jgi:hypothetical protein
MDNSFFSDKELRTNSELAHTEIVIAALFLTLTWTVVGLRFWVRSHMLHSTGADDWLVLFSQVCSYDTSKVKPSDALPSVIFYIILRRATRNTTSNPRN